jgi:hypothetical protein
MPVIFLGEGGLVVAVFLKPEDAKEYESLSKHRYCAVAFNEANRDQKPLPKVGDIYKA